MLQVGSLWQWLVQLKNQRWCVTLQLVSFSNILLPLLLPLSSSWLYFMLPVCAGLCSHITKTGQKEKKASSKDRTICSLTQDIQGRKRYELYPMLHWFFFSSCLLHSLSTHSSPPQSSSDPNVFPLARSLTATFQGMHGMPGMYEQQMQGGTWQTRLLHFKGLFLVPFLIILFFVRPPLFLRRYATSASVWYGSATGLSSWTEWAEDAAGNGSAGWYGWSSIPGKVRFFELLIFYIYFFVRRTFATRIYTCWRRRSNLHLSLSTSAVSNEKNSWAP